MAFEDWKKEGIQYPRLLTVPGNQVLCFLLQRAHTFPSISFVTEVSIEVFLVVLDIPGQTVFWKGYSFPNLIPSCSDIFSIFPPCPQAILASTLCRLPIHPRRPPGIFVWLLLSHWAIIEYYQAFLGLSFLQGFISLYSTKNILENGKVCSPEVQDSELAVRSPSCPKDLELILNSTISWLLQVRGSTSQRITDKSLSIPYSFPWIPHNLLHYHTHFVKSHIWL